MRRAPAVALAASLGALAACTTPKPVAELARPVPPFDVAGFFAGRSSGEGTLTLRFKDPQPVRVRSEGKQLVDGTLVLDQIVERGERPPQRRQWRLHPDGPNRWEGTLSEATDRVKAEVSGNQLTIRYPMRGGVKATQFIYLQPDGRTALNRMTFTMAGVRVGTLDETITRAE